jgi:hypothetical protein
MSNTESSLPPDSPRFFKRVWLWLAAIAAVLTILVTIVNQSGQLIDGVRKLFASSPEHPSVSPPISAQGHHQQQEEEPGAEPQRAPSPDPQSEQLRREAEELTREMNKAAIERQRRDAKEVIDSLQK